MFFFRISLRRATNLGEIYSQTNLFCLFQPLPAISLSLTSCIFTILVHLRVEQQQRSRLVLFLTDFPRNCHDYTQPCKKTANLSRENRSSGAKNSPAKILRSFSLSYENDPKRAAPRALSLPKEGDPVGLACLRNKIRAGIFGHFRILLANFRTNDQNRNQSRRFQVRRKNVEPNPDS